MDSPVNLIEIMFKDYVTVGGAMAPRLVEKEDFRIKRIYYLNILDKVPISPYCAYQVWEHALCITLGLLKMAVSEVLCKGTPYFRSFLAKATCTNRTVGCYSYMRFIWLSFSFRNNRNDSSGRALT